MSSKNHEENGYQDVLDLLNVLHQMCVSYTLRSGCIAKSGCLRHAYLKVDGPKIGYFFQPTHFS